MPPAQALNGLIREALIALRSHTKGCLELPFRKRIWTCFGPRMDTRKRVQNGPGWRRRLRLAVLCVEKTLPIWDRVEPGNSLPRDVLASIQRYQAKQIRLATLVRRLPAAWGQMECLGVETQVATEILVGSASIKAGYVALGDEDFDPEDPNSAELDEHRDPYDLDAGFYAAAAYSGEMYGGTKAIVAKRRRFWRWYLEEAVPIAWAEVKVD